MVRQPITMIKTAATAATALAAALAATNAAASTEVRWTFRDDTDASFEHVLERINAQTGLTLTAADFRLGEDRDLAFDHYQRYDQILSDLDVRGMSIRLWTTRGEKVATLLQVEARVEAPAQIAPELSSAQRARGRSLAQGDLSWANTLATQQVAVSEDPSIRSIDAKTTWANGRLIRAVVIKARHGVHHVDVDVLSRAVVSSTYEPFATADDAGKVEARDEYSIPAAIYPFYEEAEGAPGVKLPRKFVQLKHLKRVRPAAPDTDPYTSLRDRQYLESLLDPVRGDTQEGRDAGYWTLPWLKGQVAAVRAQIPTVSNLPSDGDALLYGKYATININPLAYDSFEGITLPKRFSDQVTFNWQPFGEDDYEVIPTTAFFGKTLEGRGGALKRPNTRLPEHDAATYMNEGFDEVQVYYAIDQLFESLRPLGFTDPDLGDRPFNAFLYDPDIGSRDNAYYTDDTINFTTYSAESGNMARDNTTIWHELGHGVMDRLMGDQLHLADTGGLSEGMADFVAEMVLRETNGKRPFPGSDKRRIINSTGFFLTNEVHDDGEAYGGTMKAILDLATDKFGEREGLKKVVDLVLEAMRLSRDNPELTAQAWFDHMLFADEIGRPGVRASGELAELIHQALDSRNFADEATRASYSFKYEGEEIVAGHVGSRGNGLPLELAADATSTHTLEISLHDGAAYQFHYPVEVRVFYNSGPLQGAIDWEGEDTEPTIFQVAGPDQTLELPVTAKGQCDAINRADGRCGDFAYVQLFNAGESQPVGKKRFYLTIKTLTGVEN